MWYFKLKSLVTSNMFHKLKLTQFDNYKLFWQKQECYTRRTVTARLFSIAGNSHHSFFICSKLLGSCQWKSPSASPSLFNFLCYNTKFQGGATYFEKLFQQSITFTYAYPLSITLWMNVTTSGTYCVIRVKQSTGRIWKKNKHISINTSGNIPKCDHFICHRKCKKF